MRYYTAAQAAKEIGVSDKTLRRWVTPDKTGKVKLASERTPSNRLKIAESDVLRLKQEVELEHSQFVVSEQELDTSGHDVQVLETRIEELEQEVAALKARVATFDTIPISRAQKRAADENRPIPSQLSAGTLPASDFAAKIGISYDDLKNYMRRGVYGDRLNITEIPHPARPGYVQKFLTVEQQEAARSLLRRHGKLPDEIEE
jgi:DNA-binding transcriptional MerR regulator